MCGVSREPVVGLSEPDEGVAQGNARQGCVACELDRLRGRPEADFGADGPDRRIGVECLREVMQRVVPDLRVVVEQQEAVAEAARMPRLLPPAKPRFSGLRMAIISG